MASPDQVRQANTQAVQFQKQEEARLRTKYPELADKSYTELVQQEQLDNQVAARQTYLSQGKSPEELDIARAAGTVVTEKDQERNKKLNQAVNASVLRITPAMTDEQAAINTLAVNDAYHAASTNLPRAIGAGLGFRYIPRFLVQPEVLGALNLGGGIHAASEFFGEHGWQKTARDFSKQHYLEGFESGLMDLANIGAMSFPMYTGIRNTLLSLQPVRNFRLANSMNKTLNDRRLYSTFNVPIENGYLYHAHENPSLGFIRDRIRYNNTLQPGTLHIKDGKYVSSRGTNNPELDRVWWDTQGHNTGSNVYVMQETAMPSYKLSDPMSGAVPGASAYEESYRTTMQPNTKDVVKFSLDPIFGYTAYSPYRRYTTNRMPLSELFTSETFPRNNYIITNPADRVAYFGPKHSLSEFINEDGTINLKDVMSFQRRLADQYKAIRMENRLENPAWHVTDPNTFLHTKEAAQYAYNMPAIEGVSKKDLMAAVLGHDVGKMFAGEGHGPIGADLLAQIFPDLTPEQYTAIAEHMLPAGQQSSKLGLAVKRADIGNGTMSPGEAAAFESLYKPEETVRLYRANPRNAYFKVNQAENGAAQESYTGMRSTYDLSDGSQYAALEGPTVMTKRNSYNIEDLMRDRTFRMNDDGVIVYDDPGFDFTEFLKHNPEVQEATGNEYVKGISKQDISKFYKETGLTPQRLYVRQNDDGTYIPLIGSYQVPASVNMESINQYTDNVMIPLFKKWGVSEAAVREQLTKAPQTLYYHPASTYYTLPNGLKIRRTPVNGGKIGGWHNTKTNENFVNLKSDNNVVYKGVTAPEKFEVHEVRGHGTQDLVPEQVIKIYQRLANILTEYGKWFPNVNTWQELRSVRHQIGELLDKNGISLKDIEKLSEEEILDILYNAGGYGRNYVHSIKQFDPSTQKEIVSHLKRMLLLPTVIGVIGGSYATTDDQYTNNQNN